MKCPQCGSEWHSAKEVDRCPFCDYIFPKENVDLDFLYEEIRIDTEGFKKNLFKAGHLTVKLLTFHSHTVSWDELSSNIYVDWNEDFIEKFQSKLNWNNLSWNPYLLEQLYLFITIGIGKSCQKTNRYNYLLI